MTADSLWAALDCESCDRYLVLSQLADWHRENGYNRDMRAGEEAAECLTWCRDTKKWPLQFSESHFDYPFDWWASDSGGRNANIGRGFMYHLKRNGQYKHVSDAFRDLVHAWLAHPEARPVKAEKG